MGVSGGPPPLPPLTLLAPAPVSSLPPAAPAGDEGEPGAACSTPPLLAAAEVLTALPLNPRQHEIAVTRRHGFFSEPAAGGAVAPEGAPSPPASPAGDAPAPPTRGAKLTPEGARGDADAGEGDVNTCRPELSLWCSSAASAAGTGASALPPPGAAGEGPERGGKRELEVAEAGEPCARIVRDASMDGLGGAGVSWLGNGRAEGWGVQGGTESARTPQTKQ
jgi:hypothetical protein